MTVTIHAEDDMFTVRFNPDLASVDGIKACISKLGYRPVEVDPKDPGKGADTAVRPYAKGGETLPQQVAEAVREGDATGKLVLIDFYADWCVPCRKLEKAMTQPGLRESMQNFIVLKIDTDENPDVAKYFGVKALPTLMVLDGTARERFKSVGVISPADLIRALDDLSVKKGADKDGKQREDI